jgi:hypothetical protein
VVVQFPEEAQERQLFGCLRDSFSLFVSAKHDPARRYLKHARDSAGVHPRDAVDLIYPPMDRRLRNLQAAREVHRP